MKKYHKLLPCLFCLLLLGGCFFEEEEQSVVQLPPIPVSTYTIHKQNMPIAFEYPTQLKSPQSVDIYARVEGILLKKNFTEGNVVKKGDKLFKIDPAKYQAKVKIADAQLLSAEATFKEADRNWQRSKKLFEEKALSAKERDQALSAYENAKAGVANAKASLDDARIDLGYTDVIATASGKTGIKNYDIGDLVGAQGSNNVLVTITQLDPIHAEFSIPSNDYYFIRNLEREKLIVEYILPNGQTYDKQGKLDFVDSIIDANTATIKARAIVKNTNNLLVPGEFSRIRLKGLIAKNVIAIPQAAVLQDSKGSYVYKIVDGKAISTPVVLGYSTENSFLVQSGLQEGDIIITDQLIKIRPNSAVIALESLPNQPQNP
ncbi:MAG: efflux RND transporter periplasmic adaptor subunit [Helicobacter sp.]|nr:efflux RND transporter periplasmic adaptor subunit [Helicobacter sp.]